jgi:uncharacterized protein (DUF305 family)
MPLTRMPLLRRLPALTAAVLLALPALVAAQAPIIQPGPPGQASRALAPDEASRVAGTTYTPADVRFMQDMIPHHHQALEMAELVAVLRSGGAATGCLNRRPSMPLSGPTRAS